MRVHAADAARRNLPCPCGSGKKFKKCCMGPDEGAEFLAVAAPKPKGPRPHTLAAQSAPSLNEDLGLTSTTGGRIHTKSGTARA
jgi:hypothetical protein